MVPIQHSPLPLPSSSSRRKRTRCIFQWRRTIVVVSICLCLVPRTSLAFVALVRNNNIAIATRKSLSTPLVPLVPPSSRNQSPNPIWIAANGDERVERNEVEQSQRRDVGGKLFAKSRSSSALKSARRTQRLLLMSFLIMTALARLFTSGLAIKAFTNLRNIVMASSNRIRPIGQISLLTGALALLVDFLRVKRRQAINPTSEWGRYARHPNLRGLATAHMLLLQVMPLALLGRFSPQLQHRAGQQFATGLLRIGPLYVKLGQIISSQSQLLPSAWKPSLERLQDQVPAQSGPNAEALAYSVWPGGKESFDSTFASMDWTPVAAASLGQVHRGQVLMGKDGAAPVLRPVAVKLQRPHLRQIYNHDFAMLKRMAKLVDRFFAASAGSVGGVTQSWSKIFANAESILYREIDYRDEAVNCVRFANDFGLGMNGTAIASQAQARNGEPLASAASWLRTPCVYHNMSSEQVLVMEYVPSIKITDLEALQRANVTMADRAYLADCLGRAYLRQFCANGFFSTDPHAGNLGVEILNTNDPSLPSSERVRLVFYDFGQATELRPEQSDGVLDIVGAIVDMDVDRSVESFQKMGVLKDDADLSVVRAKIANNYRTGSLQVNRKRLQSRGYKDWDAKNVSVVGNETSDFTDSQVMSYFTLPAEYAFVARALTQLDGVGKVLDPSFDFVSAAAPWMYEIKGASLYVKEEASKWIQKTFGSLL